MTLIGFPHRPARTKILRERTEALLDGRTVTIWSIRSVTGAGLTVMDLGATIMTLDVPDRLGRLGDVVLGFDHAASYLTHDAYFGAVVGRYANRIARGRFSLDGYDHRLAINDPPNALHGGAVGFDKRLWRGEVVETDDGPGLQFALACADGEEGYPGAIDVRVTYVWTEANTLIVGYAATANEATPFNISQHTYWNLAGAGDESVLDHDLRIDADFFTPVDDGLIPTGEIASVAGTPFDFRSAKPIGRNIDEESAQLRHGKGYDHNWVLTGSGLREVASLCDPKSGRTLTIRTDQPGLQFYSGNFLNGAICGKGGAAYGHRSAVALETQHFPDSPNHPHFPDTILRPGQKFESRTEFQLGVD